jgi:hypothetical protein
MAAVPGRVVVVSTSNLNSMPSGPSSLYVTADAKTWRKATLPADLAGASAVNVFAFGGRFLADGLILDPNGNRTYVDQNNVSTTWSEHAWISDDGLVWTQYSPVMPAGVGSDWFGMQAGRRGMGNGWIYTTDGATWLVDTAMLPSLHQDTEMASDGTRIIMATDWGAGFYVGEGDGRWQKLAQGGNVGSLPGGGQLLLLPDGVLWSVGGHVYFGQALSGVAPQGSLAPSKTVVPVNTPGPVASPADTPTPAPSVDEGFTTPGALSGWKGFSWGELPPDSPIVKAGAGPAVGPLGQQVLHWRGGYVASILGLWASPDGQTWVPLTVPGTQESPVFSVGPAGLVAFGGTPQGTGAPGSVWTSGDGLTWTRAGVPNLAGRLISVAGTVSGLVATVAVSSGSGDSVTNTYVVEHSTDGVNWEIEAVAPGVVLSESPNVQSNGGRFFLIGSTANALSGGDKPPFVLLSTWPTSSYVWWSDDGKTWTRSGGNFAGFAGTIQFGRDGMRLDMTLGTVPGGSGTAVSTDGGNTWIPDDKFGPLGVAPCQGECSVAADGVIGSNGTYFVAVKNGGKKAWLSYDGRTWTPIAWAGGDPSVAGYGQFAVLPRGVIEGGSYGAAQ